MSKVPDKEDEASPPDGPGIPLGIVLMLVGAYIAVGHTLFTGKTHWMMPVAGAFIALIGLDAIGGALRYPPWFVRLSVAGIVLPLNYAIFMSSLGWLRSIGGTHGPTLVRIAVAAVDLYLAYWIVATLLRLQPRRLAALAGSAALATLLQYGGVLDSIGFSSSLLPPISSGALEARRARATDPELPLQDYAGTWTAPSREPPEAAWITRIAVRFDAGGPSATLWRACASGECEAGSYAGVVEVRSAGKAQAVHFAGQTDGRYWIASLRPMARGGLQLHERRMRGAYWLSHVEQRSTLKPVPR